MPVTPGQEELSPTVLVVFGTTGDLFARKVVPSLQYLWELGHLPGRLCVLGFGRRDWDDARLQQHVREILEERASGADASEFTRLFRYQRGEFADAESFSAVRRSVDAIQDEWGVCPNRLFYLAVPPEHNTTILRNLAASGLTDACSEDEGWTRVLIEKPFGRDLPSARGANALLKDLFRPEQVYLIDHYLSKELLRGLEDFRFSNNLFESEWGRETVERIDISLLESVGVERRGAFYDGLGALRDVGQNHLMQMLALIAMEQPDSSDADAVRSARAEAIGLLRPLESHEIGSRTFRAQYSSYRGIDGVDPKSETETYFRVESELTGPRWAGVPVMIESGKRMGEACKRIVVTLRALVTCGSRCEAPGIAEFSNRIEFMLEPDECIEIGFRAKKPGFDDVLEQRKFTFYLHDRRDRVQYVEEYGKLFYDAIRGDQSLFVSPQEIEAGWRFADPIIDGWLKGATPLASYEPDSDAVTTAAEKLMATAAPSREVGVCGLGKMGEGLARNLLDSGWRVVAWNRTAATAEKIAASAPGLQAAPTLAELVASLEPPRVVWLMVPAGAPVEELLFGGGDGGAPGLAALLASGDTVIDGGNSHYADAPRRAARLAQAGVRYLDCGTSGGPAGARAGACLMIGGSSEAFRALEPMFADVAAPGAYGYFGESGAGHFVKMVHNGIEYGMMQAIAEGFEVLRASGFDLDLAEVANVYQHRSVVESRLVGWLEEAYREYGSGLDHISGVVGHSGEGEWTIQAAEELGIPVPAITAAFQARLASAVKERYAGKVLTALRDGFGGHGIGPGGGPRR